MTLLVTGAAGFIGSALCLRLLAQGEDVVGLDNLNDYYDPALKRARLARLQEHAAFRFERLELADNGAIADLFARETFAKVAHLGAQAGVRHSLDHPHDYIQANVIGTLNILEGCRYAGVEHLVYASTSSVYGASTAMPFSPHGDADHPLAIYSASKRATELMAHAYSHLHGLPTTGLRFFTVYGPWGRPDMALFRFTKNILAGEPIEVYNAGDHARDFTYIDDIVEGIVRVLGHVPAPNPDWDSAQPDPSTAAAPWRVYNIGRGKPEPLLRYIEVLEDCLGLQAEKRLLPMQPGDVKATFADVRDLEDAVGYRPQTTVEEGVRRFVDWYRGYYGEA